MVKAETNTPEALLAGLKAGHMYASTGPHISDVTWSQDSVTVECSAATAIIVQGKGSAAIAHHGQSMTRITMDLGRVAASEWRRLTIVDAAGKRAWTNPVWMS